MAGEVVRPIEASDMAQQLERLLSATYSLSMCLEMAAERPETRRHMATLSALLKSAREEANRASWEFVGDRVKRDEAAAVARAGGAG